MTKILTFIPIFLYFSSVKSQQIAPDFTLTDVWGVQRNLYQALDSGKTVVLDFFITSCGTCQINTPSLDSIWDDLGYNGDSIWVWGIESSGRNDSAILAFMQQFNADYPFFSTANDDVVTYIYHITYTPQYYVVCPDRTMKQVAIQQVRDAIGGCDALEMISKSMYDKIIIAEKEIYFPEGVFSKIQIFNTQGMLMKELIPQTSSVNFYNLKTGIYLLRFYNGEKIYVRKLCIY